MQKLTIGIVILASLAASMHVWNCAVKENAGGHYADPYPGVKARRFIQLPIGAVRPEGWLKGTLQAWGEGITGNLHKYRPDTFWNTWDDRQYRRNAQAELFPYVQQAYRTNELDRFRPESISLWWPFEQQGYWADGIVQLAYILDDERLISIADEFINKVLAGQNPDGYMGITPSDPYSNSGDIYVLSELTVGLMSYYSATKDQRIIPAMQKAFRHILANCKPLSGKDGAYNPAWEGTGWPYSCHIIDAVLWVYSKTGDQQMMELANVIYEAMQEIDSAFQTQHLLSEGATLYGKHGVDVAETIRVPALYYLYSGDPDDLNASIKGIESGDRFHGQVHGGTASDEHLREPGALSRTEFCIHTTWSATKQTMFSITGDVEYADGVERILFNLGPGSWRQDGKSIQYFTAANQVACTSTSCNIPHSRRPIHRQLFRPDGDPGVLCCIGESTRLYPNYVANAMWLASPENGLAAVCFGPSSVSAKVGESGRIVKITEETNYPFEEKIRFVVESSESTEFPLYLRIPGWCKKASIEINGELYADSVRPGSMVKIDRLWTSGDKVTLHLPMNIRVSRWDKASVAVERGPLVYALKIKHNWKKVAERFSGFPDWEVRSGSAWNYALCLLDEQWKHFALISRERTPDSYFRINYPDVPEGSNPWENPPIELICKAKKVDGWEILDEDVMPDVPQSPVINDNPVEQVTLVPYGCTQIRITYFPVAAL